MTHRRPPRAPIDRRIVLTVVGVLVGHAAVVATLAAERDPVVSGEPTSEQIAEMQRLLRVSAEDDEAQETAADGADLKEGGLGVRAKGEEGSMGDPAARATGQRFGVRGPADRRGAAMAEAQEFGMIGLLNAGAGGDPLAPVAPWGREPVAPIPRGGEEEPLDANGRFATTYRPGRGHLAAFEAAIARGVIPEAARELVADVAAGGESDLAAPTDRALAWRVDVERTRPAPDGGENHLRIALRSSARSAGRPQLGVHLVLDTSGSMEGEAMTRAKQAARALVDRLAPTDRFSLVAFSSSAEVKVKEGPVGARRAAIQAVIDGLRADGGTNISEGMRLAYAEAREGAPPDAVRVVLLMSDGRPNAGTTGREPLARLALDAFQDGIQTSAFGLGADFDGALMSQIAADGAGGYHYVATPDQIGGALATELERRLDPVALGVEVRVRLRPDVQLLAAYGSRRLGAAEASKVRAQEVAVDVAAAAQQGIARDREDDAEGGMRFFVPAFGRDDAHAILLKLRLPPGAGDRAVATVEVKYKDLLARKNVTDERALKLHWADSLADSAASVDPSVQRAAQRFAAGEALATASRRALAGDRAGALALLDERSGILRHASVALGDASLAREADRLGRLRAFVDPSGALGDPLAVAMMVEAAGQSRLR
jgi:Mg-chelatase subunit ChlD